MSLVELLMTTLVMGIVAAGTSGLIMLNNMANMQVLNKVDDLNAARQAMERIGHDVRMARNVGDGYGVKNPLTGLVEGSDQFPVQEGNNGRNPHYGNGQAPSDGWPVQVSATPQLPAWPARPYRLSPQTLIVQVPVFYLAPQNDPTSGAYNPGAIQDPQNGFPTAVGAAQGDPSSAAVDPPGATQDNVDTYVYQVLEYPTGSGEYILQVAGFASLNSTNPNKPSWMTMRSSPPETILSGIVGPKDPNTGVPKVFQYLDKTDPTGTPRDTVGPGSPTNTAITNVTGVIVNLEVKRDQAGANSSATVGLKSEIFLRNNRVGTTSG